MGVCIFFAKMQKYHAKTKNGPNLNSFLQGEDVLLDESKLFALTHQK